jgi:hypothetical protein
MEDVHSALNVTVEAGASAALLPFLNEAIFDDKAPGNN